MKKAKINYDVQSDALYLVVKEGYEDKHQEIAPGVFVELDKAGEVIGVEILNASANIGKLFKRRAGAYAAPN